KQGGASSTGATDGLPGPSRGASSRRAKAEGCVPPLGHFSTRLAHGKHGASHSPSTSSVDALGSVCQWATHTGRGAGIVRGRVEPRALGCQHRPGTAPLGHPSPFLCKAPSEGNSGSALLFIWNQLPTPFQVVVTRLFPRGFPLDQRLRLLVGQPQN